MTLTDGDEAGKLFVGGLSWETTKEGLQQYFGRYGEVVDSIVMKNNETGRSRGFGFITFKDSGVVSAVLSAGPHTLDGKMIDPKACTPRSQQQKGPPSYNSYSERPKLNRRSDAPMKIFLGGLPPDITETEIQEAFSKFGKVTEVSIMYDQEKKKSRGFGFLSFESEDSIQKACNEHFVNINGKQIECKAAVPREKRGGDGRGRRADSFGSHGTSQYQQQWPPAANAPSVAPADGTGGYSANWGAPPQQQAYAPQNAAYTSGTSYQSYAGGAPGYDAYAAAAAAQATQYGQMGFPGYGQIPAQMPPTGAVPPAQPAVAAGPPPTDPNAVAPLPQGYDSYSQQAPAQYGQPTSYGADTQAQYAPPAAAQPYAAAAPAQPYPAGPPPPAAAPAASQGYAAPPVQTPSQGYPGQAAPQAYGAANAAAPAPPQAYGAPPAQNYNAGGAVQAARSYTQPPYHPYRR